MAKDIFSSPNVQDAGEDLGVACIPSNLANNRHGVQRRMISVDNFFVFLRLLFFALLLLYAT